MKKRRFLAPLAVSVAALSGAASPNISASTNSPEAIADTSIISPSGTSANTSGIDLVLHRSDSGGIRLAQYHYSHGSHGSHGSHTSHTSSSY